MQSKSLRLLGTFLTIAITGCATKEPWQQSANKPPRFADRVEVLVYEQPKMPPLPKIDIFDETQTIQKSHRRIALLTCHGVAREEVAMTKALIYRARMMGADAVVIVSPNGRNFRAQAVVYE